MPWLSLLGPCDVLQHDPIPVKILERPPMPIPIRIGRWDPAKSGRQHASAACLPLVLSGNVENQQMFFRGGLADLMPALRDEFEMVKLLWMSQDDTIETFVVL